ncbi:BREX-1 system adenine-specific DNA-methyltransferase PglX [Arthrobacter bambusae]|uniref:BREX-1 system adenine-specific DNA-methyltransferase PglX n=1 Tax=Arthrobacter bambusae TaxID=1338426 RepID=UPI001F51256A|nr:BREX-1 system adenine-specific DNA-methyltransferase PglX [Arthrobacter bambusae]MCI0140658.1 BREX-1 system adenine-specific DNA-methyltransferase PglX [Arthrobacter bambusae]
MDTKPLERFATQARRDLLAAVDAQATASLAAGSVARSEHGEVVKKLEVEVAAHGRAHVIDRVAYTWFNRIIALRFMDARGYTDAGVVSPAQGQAYGQPEILADAKRGNLNTDVVINKNTAEAIIGLLDGTRRSTDAEGEAYALLLTEYCRYWHKSMPFMFEREGDYTELLVPTGLLADGAILSRAREVLTDEVCEDVEVIGWLYQFYISERKQEIFDSKAKRGAAEIPAATQLFTPHWIVRYLVENSLGRLWLLNRPSSRLTDQMDYYIPPVDEETDHLEVSSPEELKVIDPACGSGHMLTYAFDLLYAIYEEEGYAPSDIPGLILSNNLYGTEIDARAGALAAFAITMKARARQRTFFNNQVQPNICVLDPISFGPSELDFLLIPGGDRPEEIAFWNQFAEADTLGALIRSDAYETARFARHLETLDDGGDLIRADVLERARRVVAQAQYLTPRYSVLVANPPYMGSGNMGDQLAQFAGRHFKTSKYDLFAMFIERSFGLLTSLGYSALVTMEAWMTGAAYARFRQDVIFQQDLRSLVHMPYLGKGRTAMGINFGISATVLRRAVGGADRAAFQCIRHFELDELGVPFEFPVRNGRASLLRMRELANIPGRPVIYAASHEDLAALASRSKVADLVTTREGLTTGDNDRFLRRWFEVSNGSIAPPDQADEDRDRFESHRWFMHVKGGEFRRWYGNLEFVVDWESDGARVKANIDSKTGRVRSHNYNGEYGFLEGLTWSGISSSRFSARYVPAGHMFDTKGPMGFGRDRNDLLATLAVLNSGAADRFLSMLAPNLDFKLGHVLSLPVPADAGVRVELSQIAEDAIKASKALWDESETSADFDGSPLLRRTLRIADCIRQVEIERDAIAASLTDMRKRVDLLVLAGRGGQGDSTKSAEDDPEILPISSAERIKDFISYAVGCMLGRYSLNKPGLILADQDATLQDYLATVSSPTFGPDADNVIPFVDDGWFEDDIVERFRQFLRAAFGAEHFEENLRFVTEALGVNDVRDYFITKTGKSKFYDDHVQRYKKRPIYWMFSSLKGSFNALIYMHRYNPSTVPTVLNEYLREYRAKLEVELSKAEQAAAAGSTNDQKEADRLRKVIAEIRDYERDVLYPLATQQLTIDLNDGVKANYPKFYPALKKIVGLEAAE